MNDKGQPRRNPERDATVPGSPVNGDVTNHPPPSYSSDSGHFYVPKNNNLHISYLIDLGPRGSMSFGGTGGAGFSYGSNIDAIDPRTGKIVWRHPIDASPGLLTAAGKLLFSGNGAYLIALDVTTGKALWHSKAGAAGNAPETYVLGGKRYRLATGGNQLFAFVLNQSAAPEKPVATGKSAPAAAGH